MTQPRLPIIDISPYLPPKPSKATSTTTSSSSSASTSPASRTITASSIHSACRDYGFFYLCVPDHFISQSEMDHILSLGHQCFELPQDVKDEIKIENGDGVRGYQRLHQNVTQCKTDHHEGFDLYAPNPYPPRSSTTSARLRPLEGANQFPTSSLPTFQPTLEAWVAKMLILGDAVMHAMADGLGMSQDEWERVKSLVDHRFWVMRVIGYPPLPDGNDGYSCGEHNDYACLTFLLADPIPGALQVLSHHSSSSDPSSTTGTGPVTKTKTKTWLPADPIQSCFVVNIGDMWDLWSGGLYPATLHRVIHRSQTYRVSIPFFFEPNFNARITVLDAANRVKRKEGLLCESKVGGEDGAVIYGDFLRSKVEGNFKY